MDYNCLFTPDLAYKKLKESNFSIDSLSNLFIKHEVEEIFVFLYFINITKKKIMKY